MLEVTGKWFILIIIKICVNHVKRQSHMLLESRSNVADRESSIL